MTYHLFVRKDPNRNYSDNNLLGESSFNNFWTGMAWDSLRYIQQRKPKLLEDLVVVTSSNEQLELDEFLDRVDKLHIIQN